MKPFLRKYAKLLFIGAIVLLLIIGYGRYFANKLFNLGCMPEPEPVVIVDTWSKPLQEAGYKPATIEKPDLIQGDKFPESVTSTMYASGTVGESDIEVSVVSTIDGQTWLKAVVDGNVAKWEKVQYWNEPKPVHDNDFSLLIECAMIDGADFGAGVAYCPVSILGADIGLAVTVDVNRDILTAPSWLAVSGRLSRSWGPLVIGADIGYRFFEDAGLHTGVGIGLKIGL